VLGVEVNSPDPVHLPVRASTEGVYRQVVELVAARRCSGLVDQADGHAVIGVDATAVLVKGATEGRPEQQSAPGRWNCYGDRVESV
jgi:hypothetical protein